MAVVTPFDVEACNRALGEAGFLGAVHLRDACGAQSLSWDASLEQGPEPIGPWLVAFFGERGVTVRVTGPGTVVVER